MQIREVELRTGLDRANIRYYEREGLLSPNRSENGYREYTEADVETLERIKLLRELDVSLEDIRRLQRDEVPLRELMERRLESLGSQAEELMRLGRICQALCQDNVSYQTLDVGRYRQVWLLEKPPMPSPALRRDVTPRIRHPWRRYFARMLDISLVTFLLFCVWFLILGKRMDVGNSNNWLVDWLAIYLSWGLLFVVEPLLLSRFGTTPGKWLFGLSLTHESGRRLTFGEACSRLWGVFGRGYGYGIPIYILVRLWKSERADSRGEALDWEEDSVYTIRDTHWLRGAGYVVVSALIMLLTLAIGFRSMLPVNRGPLTRAEFVENFNDYYLYYTEDPGNAIDENGRWIKTGEAYQSSYMAAVFPRENFTIEEQDGLVCAVSYQVAGGKEENLVFGSDYQMQLSYLALAGAQKGVSGWELLKSLESVPELSQPFRTFSVDVLGVRLENTAEFNGYETMDGNMLILVDGAEKIWYRQSFSIRIPE